MYMNKVINNYSIDLPNFKKIKNINKDDFNILKFEEYDQIHLNNFKLPQLRVMCKHYKLKSSGNKKDLSYILYNFLRLSFYARNLQKYYRGHLQRKYNKLHGPAFLNRKLCTNNQDFFTLEELVTIPQYQFFSYTDKDNFVYGFDIMSLYNWIVKNNTNKSILNPFNRAVINCEVINNINKLIKLTKILNYPIAIKIKEDNEVLTPKKRKELRIISLFQKINELGNYADAKWFSDLPPNKLLLFVRELYDIWNYRAQIPTSIKIEICPPNGNPFHSISMLHLQNISFNYLQSLVLSILESLVNINSTSSNKHLGSLYILSALCLVNNDAANALPWLYQSVMHT